MPVVFEWFMTKSADPAKPADPVKTPAPVKTPDPPKTEIYERGTLPRGSSVSENLESNGLTSPFAPR